MRLTLDSLGLCQTLRIAPEASQTPFSRAICGPLPQRAVSTGSAGSTDPFVAVEGREHHRSPARLAQRIVELERDCDRQANIRAELADEVARLRAVCGLLADALRAELRRGDLDRTVEISKMPDGDTAAGWQSMDHVRAALEAAANDDGDGIAVALTRDQPED